jgi:hypothetical protein
MTMPMEDMIAEMEASGFNVAMRNTGEEHEGYVVWGPSGRPYTEAYATPDLAWAQATTLWSVAREPGTPRLDAIRAAEAAEAERLANLVPNFAD